MADNKFTVCSIGTAARMQDIVAEVFEKDKYAIFSWKIGATSTMPQKALIHIWFRKWAAYALRKPERDVTEREIAGMKRSVKARYYHATGEAFMVEEIADPLAPDRKRMEYTSIADWTPGECFSVMEWMQLTAAEHDLVLESIGEHKQMKSQGI